MAKKNGKIAANKKKTLMLLSMVLPGTLWLFLFRYVPIFGIVMAFQNYKIVKPQKVTILGHTFKLNNYVSNLLSSDFVGFKNFEFLFKAPTTKVMIRNTLGYNVLFILLGLVISVAFAIMLNELTSKLTAKTYQTLMFFPYFLSWVVASYFVTGFLDPTRGIIPNMMRNHGWQVIDFYNTSKPWPFILTLSNVWKQTGYSTILYLAAITGIDTSQYEAASIDGASKWQQIKYVTIPHLKTMIIILFIMNVGKIFNSDFGLFYNVPNNSGLIKDVTETIDTYVYNAIGGTGGNFSMTAAAGLMQNLIGFICIMIANTIVRKVDEDSALF